MKVYLGLGSNLGDRRAHLSAGLAELHAGGLGNVRVSPVVETPALLPDGAPADWNLPFLNVVVEATTTDSPQHWLARIKTIQDAAGKRDGSRWSPRALDIDILLWGNQRVASADLSVPHAQLERRAFVLVPLAHLAPRLDTALLGGRSPLALARTLEHRLPLWMGVLNVTPDSFSDGANQLHPDIDALAAQAQSLHADGAHIIDIGAESTRPGATPLDANEEWQRLGPRLAAVLDTFAGDRLRPRISVDTYHAETAARSLEAGADIINDVGGLQSTEMCALAASGGEWVAMHNLGLPASRDTVLPTDADPVTAVANWLEHQLARWSEAGIDPLRVHFDPGIGFGKNTLQSMQLLRRLREFHRYGLRILVGHSRKSFMGAFSGPPETRDIETVGASLKLCEQGADVLRVHDVQMHARAFSAYAHLQE